MHNRQTTSRMHIIIAEEHASHEHHVYNHRHMGEEQRRDERKNVGEEKRKKLREEKIGRKEAAYWWYSEKGGGSRSDWQMSQTAALLGGVLGKGWGYVVLTFGDVHGKLNGFVFSAVERALRGQFYAIERSKGQVWKKQGGSVSAADIITCEWGE